MPKLVLLIVAWIAGLSMAAVAHEGARAGASPVGRSAQFFFLLGGAGAAATAVANAASRQAARRDQAVTVAAAIAVAASALLLGDASWRRSARCTQLLGAPSQPRLARLADQVEAGGWVQGEFQGATPATARCLVPASLAVKEGRGDAGAWVSVQGDVLPSGASLRVTNAVITPTGTVDWLHGWRGRTGRTIDTLFGARAPLVRALLVADRQGIAPDVRDRFATAGLVHLLSISGLHVAIIAGALRTIFAACRLPRRGAELAALLGVVSYVVLLGIPPPATRAATMLAVLLLVRCLDRPVHPWTALALGVAVPTADVQAVASLGWQLSASGMAGLVGARAMMRRWRTHPMPTLRNPSRAGTSHPGAPHTVTPHTGATSGGAFGAPVSNRSVFTYSALAAGLGRLSHRIRHTGPRLRGWRLTLATELLMGVAASVITAPLVAWAFGRVSLVAPLANLAAAPFVAFLQPTLFLALLLAPFPALARTVAAAATVPLVAVDLVARTASAIPYAALDVAPGYLTAACAVVMVAMLLLATARRRVFPPLLVGAGALVCAIWWPVISRGPGVMELHMVDVGQGDALAVRTPRGRWVLIDAGRSWEGGDAGRRAVVPYLKSRGGDVALFVLTHPDADHVGGAASLLEAVRPARWWDPGFVHGSDAYRHALAVAAASGIPWRRAQAGDSLWFDGVLFRVLGPDSVTVAAGRNANDASLVLLVQHGAIRMLLTGDAERAEEEWLVDQWGAGLAAQVLKVGHHGSRTSSGEAFLDAVNPEIALISVGADNRYGHPAPEVMARLQAREVQLLRTDRDGSIVVRSNGRSVHLETRHTAWTHTIR